MKKPYYEQSCPRCGKPTSNGKALNTVSHLVQLNKKAKCSICGKKLSDYSGSVFERKD